ncbi:MAG: bifunctional riboflavin kinase/FAD synthetase [Chloroflexota bacterium]|nr:bifunctional riboflavin kinase/FAD synthetase [Chloroflexota bacterium]
MRQELAQFSSQREAALTIGVFDGVHLGHQHLISILKQHAEARGYVPGVVTFRSHPQQILFPNNSVIYLSSLEDRIRRLHDLGIDLVVPLSFTMDLAKTPAHTFVSLLKEYLDVSLLVVGPDFALGRGREGDITTLTSLGHELGFGVEVAAPLVLDGEVVSSTLIRQAVAAGDVTKVKKLLGRPHTLNGEVVHGDSRGRTIGFPTANLEINSDQAVPANGVYATKAFVEQQVYSSVTSIGNRPTFGGLKRTIEVYLLDFQGELYNSKLCIELLKRLREEQRFSSKEELVAQIECDVEQAREVLRSEE